MTKTRFGFFVKCPSMEMIEAMGIAGCDFAVVDMEHTPLGPRDLYPLLLAAERRNLELIVRIPTKTDYYMKWCRDLNVHTIQVPHVESAKDVEFAIQHTMFNPVGNRGLCRFVRASDFSGKNKDEYLDSANGSNKLILQIEGLNAVKNIEEIISATPKFISLFVGPYDLSQSMGMPGDIWNPNVKDKMKYIIDLCKKSGIEIGTFTDTEEGLAYWKNQGIDFIQYSSDLNCFIKAARSLMSITTYPLGY
ncbi:MAG: aldolase [Synechococcaceae bacterium WB8_1B_057]|nr:aldolase [Synechococcaceae bacterium WB6_1A_059]NDG79599.1 aldolase [Synechococcaceae bacterium WB8_1B_057]